MARQGLTAYLDAQAAAGRHGDTELAHFSRDELDLMDTLQGGPSINPVTGRREYFKFGKILKSVAKAAGALAGGYFGGPAGAAIGAGAVSKLMGDSTTKALTTGLLSGLGAWGAQQTGLGDIVGGGFSSGADLLGQQAAGTGIETASAAADSVASSSGSGFSLSSALPFLGAGAAALGAAAYKPPKGEGPAAPDTSEPVEYEPLERDPLEYQGDPYNYGIFGPEFQYFDQVNPALEPLAMRDGGRVAYKYGGNVSEGGKKSGASESGGQGHNAGGNRGDNRGTAGQQQDRRNAETARRSGNVAPGVSTMDRERVAREQYSKSMQQGNQANLAGPHGYMGAVDKYQKRGGLWDVLDFIGGPFIDTNPPDVTVPESYVGGDWHTSTNVGGALGTIGGAATGLIGLGTVGGWLDDQLGIPDIYHGGPGYVSDAARAYQESLGGGSAPPQGGGEGEGKFGQIGSIVQAAQLGAGNPATPGKIRDKVIRPDDRDRTEGTGRTFKPITDPYTYGQFGPEHDFFIGELNMRDGGNVKGPGTGQSDDIPAMLARDEHVIDAETVAMIGDGSSDAGHAKIEQFKKAIRTHKRGAKPGSIPPKARSIGDYMKGMAA